MGEISAESLADLHKLELAVSPAWRSLSDARKNSIWLAGIEERFAASNNGVEEAARWIEVSRKLLKEDLREGQILLEPLMQTLNAGLRGLPGKSQYRDYTAISADLTFAPPELIHPELIKLREVCAKIDLPLVKISFLAQEILSIHPFQDGNGRTVRLITDLLLKDADYPPPQYFSPLDFMIARSWEKPAQHCLEHSVLVIAGAVERGLGSL